MFGWIRSFFIKQQVNKIKKENPDMMEFLSGKKTYLTAILFAVLAGLQFYGIHTPDWIYTILGAFGLGSLRSAVNKIEKNV